MHTVVRWSTMGAILLSALLLCQSCSKEASFEPLFELDPGGRFRSDTLVAEASDWFNRGKSAGPGWSSTRMVVCNWQGYNSRCFLRFTAFPDTDVAIDRVMLYLWRTRTDGDGGEVVLDVHTLVDTLEQYDLYWSEMPGISEDPIASFVVPPPDPPDTDSVFVDITEAVTSWIKHEESNFGIVLKAPDEAGPEFVVEFATREVSKRTIDDSTSLDFRPALRIAYVDTEGEDQKAVSIAAEDTFADTLLTPFPDDGLHLLCGRGFPSRAFVRFDLDQIPEGATVIQSVLSLVIDGSASSFDSMGVTCHAILEEPWEGFDTSIGATGIETITIKAEDLAADSTLQMDITALVQPLVARHEANSGFAVKASNEVFDLDFVRFWSNAQPDSGLRPRLVVDYVIPPAPPYAEVQQP
jgi:hypothetical protein